MASGVGVKFKFIKVAIRVVYKQKSSFNFILEIELNLILFFFHFSEPSLDKNCIVFSVSDNNAVQEMPLEWKTYDCSLASDSIPICQYPSSNIDFNIKEPQGT